MRDLCLSFSLSLLLCLSDEINEELKQEQTKQPTLQGRKLMTFKLHCLSHIQDLKRDAYYFSYIYSTHVVYREQRSQVPSIWWSPLWRPATAMPLPPSPSCLHECNGTIDDTCSAVSPGGHDLEGSQKTSMCSTPVRNSAWFHFPSLSVQNT